MEQGKKKTARERAQDKAFVAQMGLSLSTLLLATITIVVVLMSR